MKLYYLLIEIVSYRKRELGIEGRCNLAKLRGNLKLDWCCIRIGRWSLIRSKINSYSFKRERKPPQSPKATNRKDSALERAKKLIITKLRDSRTFVICDSIDSSVVWNENKTKGSQRKGSIRIFQEPSSFQWRLATGSLAENFFCANKLLYLAHQVVEKWTLQN